MPVPNLNFTPYINPYVEGATKEYAGLQDRLRQDYDSAAEQYDVLEEASKTMSALTQDEELKNKILQETQDRIKTAAERGDYENLGRIARRESREFAAKYKPVLEQVQKVSEYQKSQKELFEKGFIDKTQYDKSIAESINRYKGLEAGDTFVGHTNAKKIDVAEKMSKMFDHYNADAIERNTDYRLTSNGMLKNIKTGVETVPTEDVYRDLTQYAKTDPEIQEYLSDLVYLNTYDLSDDDVKNTINDSFINLLNSGKLTNQQKESLSDNFNRVMSASPQEQKAYLQNLLKDERISKLAQPIAEREGYSKITQDIDLKNLPDAILEDMLGKVKTPFLGTQTNARYGVETFSDIENNVKTTEDDIRQIYNSLTPSSDTNPFTRGQVVKNMPLEQIETEIVNNPNFAENRDELLDKIADIKAQKNLLNEADRYAKSQMTKKEIEGVQKAPSLKSTYVDINGKTVNANSVNRAIENSDFVGRFPDKVVGNIDGKEVVFSGKEALYIQQKQGEYVKVQPDTKKYNTLKEKFLKDEVAQQRNIPVYSSLGSSKEEQTYSQKQLEESTSPDMLMTLNYSGLGINPDGSKSFKSINDFLSENGISLKDKNTAVTSRYVAGDFINTAENSDVKTNGVVVSIAKDNKTYDFYIPSTEIKTSSLQQTLANISPLEKYVEKAKKSGAAEYSRKLTQPVSFNGKEYPAGTTILLKFPNRKDRNNVTIDFK